MEDKLKLIKEIILNTAKKYNIEIDRIILFGSRARGDYREDSDWDILIVTKEKLDKSIKEKYILDILRTWTKYRLLSEDYNQDLHLIVVSLKNFNRYRGTVGDIIGFASLEGVVV